jgi:hypothetical protein
MNGLGISGERNDASHCAKLADGQPLGLGEKVKRMVYIANQPSNVESRSRPNRRDFLSESG